MKYLDKKKDWRYMAKSSGLTFASSFLTVFAGLVAQYDLSGVDPDKLTGAVVLGVLVTLGRLALIALAVAGQKTLSRLKR